ncbi:winged helix-turn-helix domain-containing protein [Streptomyces sp. NPDC091649]|uniref:winged helix-turn-helix domain-containing protein n=2 Tax=unclassified Streptomyces TaxID=2593676 RepID=UPI0037F4AE1E
MESFDGLSASTARETNHFLSEDPTRAGAGIYDAGMQLTPHEVLGRWLLATLGEMGGGGSKQAVLRRIHERYGSQLTETDHLPQPSNGEVKWENRTAWQRNRMVKAGLLKPYVQRGDPWTLTEAGWAALCALSPAREEMVARAQAHGTASQ